MLRHFRATTTDQLTHLVSWLIEENNKHPKIKYLITITIIDKSYAKLETDNVQLLPPFFKTYKDQWTQVHISILTPNKNGEWK